VLITESIIQALRMLEAQKLRALLTLFGFVWGTASVIFLVGWGDGVTVMLEDGFAKTGRNMGVMGPGFITADFTPAADRRYLWVENDDVEVMRRRSKLAEVVGGESQQFKTIAYGQSSFAIDIRGMEPETVDIRGVRVATGRPLTRTDLLHERRVVLLGDGMRRRLLGTNARLDAVVRLDGLPFKVVGFLEPVGVQLNRDGNLIDDQAWIPLTTYQKYWPAWWTDQPVVGSILYRVRDRRLYEQTRDELRAILARRLDVSPDDSGAVWGYSPVEMLNKLQLGRTRGMMFVIALTTLMVGGIGVLTMMLDSVHDRRQEIGVRRAVGATRREVLLQFFIETLVVSLLGGAIGLALGVGGCLALGALDLPDLVPVPILSTRVIVLTTLVMGSIGVGAGLVPAWRATLVEPADSLRSD
jgi:putative ABC transport system permease protein